MSFGFSSTCFKSVSPARGLVEAMRRTEPLWGASDPLFEIAENGPLSDAMLESMRAHHPGVRLLAHGAIAAFGKTHVDMASMHLGDQPAIVEQTLGFLARHGIGLWTIHAGFERHASLDDVIERTRVLNTYTGGKPVIAIEGNPPVRGALMGSWDDYRVVLDSGVPFCLNMAHMDLLTRREGEEAGLLAHLLAAPSCRLIHASGTDGRSMRHWLLAQRPWWYPWVRGPQARQNLTVITEADHVAGQVAPADEEEPDCFDEAA